jgi:ketosteroid isomerase-like protein
MTHKTKLKLTCAASLLTATLSIHTPTFADQGTQTMDHSQIQSTIDANNAAVASGNMDAILATYEPTATLAAQPGMLATGTPALREAFQHFLGLNPKITIINQDVIQSTDIALHSYTWKMAGKTPDGHPVEQSGFSIIVLRKQADGKWLMVIDNPFGDQVLKKG